MANAALIRLSIPDESSGNTLRVDVNSMRIRKMSLRIRTQSENDTIHELSLQPQPEFEITARQLDSFFRMADNPGGSLVPQHGIQFEPLTFMSLANIVTAYQFDPVVLSAIWAQVPKHIDALNGGIIPPDPHANPTRRWRKHWTWNHDATLQHVSVLLSKAAIVVGDKSTLEHHEERAIWDSNYIVATPLDRDLDLRTPQPLSIEQQREEQRKKTFVFFSDMMAVLQMDENRPYSDEIGRINTEMKTAHLGQFCLQWETNETQIKQFTIYEWLAKVEEVFIGRVPEGDRGSQTSSSRKRETRRKTQLPEKDARGVRLPSLSIFKWGSRSTQDQAQITDIKQRLEGILDAVDNFVIESRSRVPDILSRRGTIVQDLRHGLEQPLREEQTSQDCSDNEDAPDEEPYENDHRGGGDHADDSSEDED